MLFRSHLATILYSGIRLKSGCTKNDQFKKDKKNDICFIRAEGGAKVELFYIFITHPPFPRKYANSEI